MTHSAYVPANCSTSTAAPAASVERALRFAVPVVSARRLQSMLRALPAVLGPERVADLANRARVRFHAA